MAALPPDELLKLWKREELPLEMGMGQVLQNLADLRTDFVAQHRTLTALRTEVDRLIIHTRLPPSTKGKAKPAKPDKTSDPEQPG